MKRSLSLLMLVLFLVSCGSDKSSPLAPTAVALTAIAPPPPPPPLWMASGTGATILDMPTRLTRIRIEGVFTGRGENFIVWCGATGTTGRSLLVNEILGTRYESTTYSGVHSALRRSVWRVRDSILAKAPMDVHRRAVRERVISDREHR